MAKDQSWIADLLTGNGGGTGSTTTTASFNQPAVGSTVVIAVADATAAVENSPAQVAGGGFYIVTLVATNNVTLLNQGGPDNALLDVTISAGATVTFGGSSAPLDDKARFNGQVLQLVGGVDTPAGMRAILNLAQGNPVGDGVTDDWAKLQAALDTVTVGSQVEALLPRSGTLTTTFFPSARSFYAISQPLVINDYVAGTFTDGNSCARLRGESELSVGLIPTNNPYLTPTQAPAWLGPLLVVGAVSDANQATYVTDSGMRCLSYAAGTTPGYSINYSEYDTGNIHGLAAFCWETWWNPLADVPSSTIYELASSYGNNTIESHTALSVVRSTISGPIQVSVSLTTTKGGGTTTTAGFTVPQPQIIQLVAVGSSTGMTAGKWLTIPAVGTYVVISAPDPTHVVIIDPGLAGNVAPGTAVPNTAIIGIEGTVTATTSTGHDLTASSLQHIACDYDGAHLRLWINGVQTLNNMSGGSSDSTAMTAALTGTIIQKHFEEFVVGQSRFNNWPNTGGSVFGASGTTFHQGLNRLSNESRYTTPFAPNPSSVTCDAHTKILVDFTNPTPASNGFTSRSSAQTEWLIARSGIATDADNRRALNTPVWLRMSMSNQPFTAHAHVSNLSFYGNYVRGIEVNCATYTHLHHLQFSGVQQGINFQNFSYGSSYDHITFYQSGIPLSATNIQSGHSWLILHGHGSQFVAGSDVSATFCGNNWGLVHTFSDCTLRHWYITGEAQGSVFLGPDTGSVVADGFITDDEQASQQYACWVVNSNSLAVRGGSQSSGSYIPVFKVGVSTSTYIDTPVYPTGQYSPQNTVCVSFGPTTSGQPVVVSAAVNVENCQIIDQNFPGPVVILAQESFGVHTISPGSSTSVAVGQFPPDAFWRKNIVAAGSNAGAVTITWPANPGKIYDVRNNNAHTANLTRAGSSSPVALLTTLATVVYDNGTDLVTL